MAHVGAATGWGLVVAASRLAGALAAALRDHAEAARGEWIAAGR